MRQLTAQRPGTDEPGPWRERERHRDGQPANESSARKVAPRARMRVRHVGFEEQPWLHAGGCTAAWYSNAEVQQQAVAGGHTQNGPALCAQVPASRPRNLWAPVLLMRGWDIIYYGTDLADYINQEFQEPRPERDEDWQPRMPISRRAGAARPPRGESPATGPYRYAASHGVFSDRRWLLGFLRPVSRAG